QTALEPAPIPGESDKADVVPISSGTLLGSRVREDFSGSGVVKNSVREALNQASADRGSPPSHAKDMAGRIDEVGRLQGTNFRPITRDGQGRSSEDPSPHPPDKSGGD